MQVHTIVESLEQQMLASIGSNKQLFKLIVVKEHKPKENPNKLMIDRTQFLNSVRRVAIFSNKTTHQIRLKIAGAELNISAEDIDYSNKAEERLTCDYQGDDMQIGFNSRFLTEMLTNLQSDMIMLEMSLPNRAGILTPVDGLEEGETVTMLVMPVMLNN
jgi:DNA polymerase-3 subunit beta